MRLWTLHPQYLDPQGLVALWREALLARAVLRGQTRGYQRHPQLERFREHPAPLLAIDAYLANVHAEAVVRGYAFDGSKFDPVESLDPMAATTGQRDYEWQHLLTKLATRNPALHEKWRDLSEPECHPLFRVTPGSVAPWERIRG